MSNTLSPFTLCAALSLAACTIVAGDTSDTNAETTSTSTTTSGTDAATEPTTEPTGTHDLGCGWYGAQEYYACAPEGTPDLVDPDGLHPLACADPSALTPGAACSPADGPVNDVGCCAGDVVYYCNLDGQIAKDDCSIPGEDPGTTTTATTDTPTTDAPTTDPTATGDAPGCGWNTAEAFYACAPAGTPGLPDPDGTYPLACTDPGTLVEGADCDPGMGQVTGQGCCDGDILYYCSQNKVTREDCSTAG